MGLLRKKNCDCGALERASKEPEHAIRFDPELNEYHIVFGRDGRSKMMIYYCPICGRAVPKSRRGSLFAHVTKAESIRIRGLLKGIRTVEDVVARFGPPDEEKELAAAIGHPDEPGSPPRMELFLRTLVYKNISDVAELHFNIGPNELVHPSWSAKSLGHQKLV